jgi:hypothetical protein
MEVLHSEFEILFGDETGDEKCICSRVRFNAEFLQLR